MQTMLRRAGGLVLAQVVLALMLVGGLVVIPAGAADAGAEKVDVCHSEGNGSYHLINVAEQAHQKHVDHGDAEPGGAVPDSDGYEFDAECEVVHQQPTKCVGIDACGNPDWVGDGSCNGDYACSDNVGFVGTGSCNGDDACVGFGFGIGSNSCNSDYACDDAVDVGDNVAECEPNDVCFNP